jgi:hypothetical protein
MRPAVMGSGKYEERMGPDETGEDGNASVEVWIETAIEPDVDDPMVSPLSVTMTVVLTAMDDEAVRESTIAVAVGTELVAVTDEPLITAVGVDDIAKKPLG